MRILFFRFVIYGFVFAAFLLHASVPASAGTITLQLKISIIRIDDQMHVDLSAKNIGTAEACYLFAYLHVFDQQLESETQPLLKIQNSISFRFSVPVPPNISGTFPVVAEVVFHDANGHPFSALAGSPFHLNRETVSDLSASARDRLIMRKGNLSIRVRNLSSQPRKGLMTLYLPQAIFCSQSVRTLELDPSSGKTVDFWLEDHYETGSASYPVYCAIEYESDDLHHLELLSTMVRLRANINWFIRSRWYWLAGFVPVFIFWIVMAVRKEDIRIKG